MFSAPTETPVQLPRRRRRPPVSCQTCRQRKVKCNRQEPCNQCITSKTKCVYGNKPSQYLVPAEASKPNPPQVLTAAHESPQQLVQVSSATSSSTSQSQRSKSSPLSVQHHGLDSSQTRTVGADTITSDDSEVCEVQYEGQAPEQPSTTHLPERNGKKEKKNPLDKLDSKLATSWPMGGILTLNKSRLYGQSHWTHGGHEFQKLGALIGNGPSNPTDNETIRRLKSEISVLHHNCKILARNGKCSRPSRCLSSPESSLLSMSKAVLDSWTQIYIKHFESAFRILHVPSFWSEYEHYWKNPIEASDALKFKIQLVATIGSSLCEETAETATMRLAARQSVYAAQNWVAGPIEKDRLSIGGLQVQCLLILARQTVSVGGDLIWISIGVLVRTAIQMGLHRDPGHFTRMDALQSELRRRLWATIVELDLQAALDSGAPPQLSYDSFDTEAPLNINDKDIDDHMESLNQPPGPSATDSSLQRLLFSCLRPRIEILRSMNGGRTEMSYDKVLALSFEVNNVCNECWNHIPTNGEAQIDVFRYNFADLLLRRFLLTLHRPFASRAPTANLIAISRKIRLDSATILLSPLQNDEFSRLMLLGGGMFKNRIIHASLALASELILDLGEQAKSLSPKEPTSYRKLLILALREACSQLVRRMQLGETNVRLHMKLSMVLCQAECTESGTSLQVRLAESAKNSLELSYSTIQVASKSAVDGSSCVVGSLMSQDIDLQDMSLDFDFGDLFEMPDFDMDGTFDSFAS